MLVWQNKPLYHLTAPLRCRPSWKMAAILTFQVAVGGLLSCDPQRLLMPIFMLVSPNKPLYHLTARLRCRPSWKMAAILTFQVAVGGLLSCDPQRLLMPIFMLVSPNKPLYHLTVSAILKNGRHLEISIGSEYFLVKWPMETAHANFHACIINWKILMKIST